jgi:hypothetical protein
LQVTPVKERVIKGYNFRKTPYTGVRVVEAGIPKKIEIDTSELIVMTPGRNGISMPQVYEFPDKIKKDEYPIIYIKKRISYPNYKNKTNKAGFNTANEFIRNIRLKTAARMFLEGQTNISGVLYKVGYNSPSYFTESFRELFGMNPSDYIQQHRTAKDPENRKN